jgi:hypothetical protein
MKEVSELSTELDAMLEAMSKLRPAGFGSLATRLAGGKTGFAALEEAISGGRPLMRPLT